MGSSAISARYGGGCGTAACGAWTQLSAECESRPAARVYRWRKRWQMSPFCDFGGFGTGYFDWRVVSANAESDTVSGGNADEIVTEALPPSPILVVLVKFSATLAPWAYGGAYLAPGGNNWSQLSSANADFMTQGRNWLAADFGTLGLWQYRDPGGWANLSGADADFVIPADINSDHLDEIIGDFGLMGLWLWDSVHGRSSRMPTPNT